MIKSLSSEIKYLREDKDLPVKPKMTENLEEKYPDKKKPFPEYTSSKRKVIKKAQEELYVESLPAKVKEALEDIAADPEFQFDYNLRDDVDENLKFIVSNKEVLNNLLTGLIEDYKHDIQLEKESGVDATYLEKTLSEMEFLLNKGRVKNHPFTPDMITAKRKPSVKEGLQYLANEKTAGGLFDRVQKQQGDAQQVSGLLNSAIGKFRSLVFEVSGTEKIIEIDKTGETINMKVFEDKDSPTPSSEKKFKMPEFLNFFMQKLAPRNSQQVAQELSNKGVAEVNKGTFISVKVAMKKKSWIEDESLVENREYSYLEPLKIYNEYTDGALQVEETSPMYFKLILKGKVITEGDDIDITKRIEQMNRERGFM